MAPYLPASKMPHRKRCGMNTLILLCAPSAAKPFGVRKMNFFAERATRGADIPIVYDRAKALSIAFDVRFQP